MIEWEVMNKEKMDWFGSDKGIGSVEFCACKLCTKWKEKKVLAATGAFMSQTVAM